ncbi:MAG TPA: hypothetical protein VEC18_08640 [Myxococcota bacterium]|nr:hypothetical protein [Myxococcota bacterium]
MATTSDYHRSAALSKAAPRATRALPRALQGILLLSYPLIVYLGYSRLGARSLALLLLALYAASIALRLRGSAREIAQLLREHAGLAILLAASLATGDSTLLLFLPVIASLYLLWTFASSLRRGMPMIERFARIVEDDLPDFTLPYCRKVTIAWCAFLAANALCALILALAAPLSWWALYCGLIAHLFVAALLVGEFVLRKIWFRYYGDGWIDRAFRALFPPSASANGRRSLAYQARREREAATRSSA